MARNKARGLGDLYDLKIERGAYAVPAEARELESSWVSDTLVVSIDRLIEQAASMTKNERISLFGPSPRRAAEILGVSRQRVYQLIAAGKLQAVEIWASTNIASKDFRSPDVLAVMVTSGSLERYKASDRKPGRKSKTQVDAIPPNPKSRPRSRRR